jgi:hypothetical protein
MAWRSYLEANRTRIAAALVFALAVVCGLIPPEAAFAGVLLDMGKSDPPPPPDYAGAAVAQGAANVDAARASSKLSNPSFKTPLGWRNINYGYTFDHAGNMVPTGDMDQVAINDVLTPQGQQRWDQEQRIVGNLGNVAESGLNRVGTAMSTPFSFNSANDIQNKAEGALMSRLQPQLDRDREQLRTQLIQTGFRPGTEGYDNAMQRADQQVNDARQQAVIGALGTRGQAVQEENFLRNIPLNELNALRSGSQVSMPQFQQFSGQNIAPPPIFQGAAAQGNAAMDGYNTQAAQNAAFTQGLFSLGGAVLGAPTGGKTVGGKIFGF